MALLLGIGQARLRKAVAGTPDLRFGKKEHRSKPGTWTADSFFQVAYDSLAETLPDKLLIITSKALRTLYFHVILTKRAL